MLSMLGVRTGFLAPFPLMMPGLSLSSVRPVGPPVRTTGSGTADDPVVIQDSDEGEPEYVESDEYESDSDSVGSCGCPYHHHHHFGGWDSDDSDMSSDDYF
jgi:hypothetical protein